jgi:hypothetical protein
MTAREVGRVLIGLDAADATKCLPVIADLIVDACGVVIVMEYVFLVVLAYNRKTINKIRFFPKRH